MTKARKRDEGGFALLIVFLMAAAIAIMLYQQMPRVAFESQRDKEETLIERGSQYKRAIQLYFLEFKKYPAKIEDLESTNNKRFLRRRYIDPMTGKNEWRLVHVNGAGQLTDSLVQKPPTPLGDKNQQTANGTSPAFTSTATTPTMTPAPAAVGPDGQPLPPEVNAAVLRRPSDRQLVAPGQIPGSPNPQSTDPNDPRYWPPIFSTPANQTQPGTQPGGQPGQIPQGFVPQFPGQQFPGQQFPGQQPNQGLPNPGQVQPLQAQPYPFPVQDPNQPQQLVNGQPAFPVQPGGIQPGIPSFPGAPVGFPGQPGINPPNPNSPPPDVNQQGSTLQPVPVGQQGFNQNGQGGPANPALNMINTLLTTPRQGPNPAAAATNNTPLNTGGLAGVASNFSGPSIKTYKARSKYNEWEFIFDLKQGLPGQTNTNQQPQPNQPGAGPLSPTTPIVPPNKQ